MQRIYVFLICAYLLLGRTAWASVRIAIIAPDEVARGAADLLTAGLSSATNIVLVERNEVDKVFRERALAATDRNNVVNLGQMLHADGIVLLERVQAANDSRLAVRLVTVNSGAVLDAALYPYPIPEPAHWAEIASARVTTFLPKFLVTKEEAIPISILNLHAAVATPQAAQTERALSTLLFHRLAAEPEIFVLERRQLGRSEWEKTLAADESAFWTGGYLLEGVIDPDGSSGDVMTVNVKLIPPHAGEAIDISAAGPRRNLTQIAEQLVQRILTALKTKPKISQWDSTREAKQFEQEAAWAIRWKMWPEAYAAAESSWALGQHNETVATYKVIALLAQIIPDAEWRDNVELHVVESNLGRRFDPIQNVAWTSNAPKPTDVPLMMEAVSTYSGITRTPDVKWQTNAAWLELGSNTLATASAVIRHQYFYGWRRNEFPPDLAILREEIRAIATLLPFKTTQRALVRFGPVWQETPLAAIREYREAVKWDDIDQEMFSMRDKFEPFWVGWTPSDRETGKHQWDEFLAELCASTNQLTRARGALLKLFDARWDPDIALASEEFLDAAMGEARVRFSTNISFQLVDCFDQELSNKCMHPLTLRRQRLLQAWKRCEFARMKHYLQTAKTHNVDRAGWPYAQHLFTQEQAKELLPVVDDYIHRIGGDWMRTVRDHVAQEANTALDSFDAFFAEPVFDAARFHQLFVEHEFTLDEAKRLVYPVRAYANRVGWTDDITKVDQRLHAMLDAAEAATTSADPIVSALNVTRQLHPMFKDSRGEELPAKYGEWFERDGRIITVGRHPKDGVVWPPVSDGPHVIVMDLMTGKSRTLPQVVSLGQFQPLKFQVLGDRVYWINGESKISVLNLNSDTSADYPVDLPLWTANFVPLNERLFIVNDDYIAEFILRDHTVKLLASKRRKPAANPLDDFSGWTTRPKLWMDRNGGLFARVGGTNAWSYNQQENKWHDVATGIQPDGSSWTFSANSSFSECLDERINENGTRQKILSDDPALLPWWRMPFDYPFTPGETFGNSATHLFDGKNLLILMPPSKLKILPNHVSLEPLKDRDLTLLWFDPQWEMPFSIPLRFKANSEMSDSTASHEFHALNCTLTDKGLVFSPPIVPGSIISGGAIWFIPWSELRAWKTKCQLDKRNLPRTATERMHKFDSDADGRLNQQEWNDMHKDSDWRQEEEKLESRRLLLTFDLNQDDQLDTNELKTLGGFVSRYTFVPRFGQRNFYSPPGQQRSPGLLENDSNHDAIITGDEILTLYRQISTPSATMYYPGFASPSDFQRTTSTNSMADVLLRYDKNQNGKIDPEERHEMLSPRMRAFDVNTNGILEPLERESFRNSLMNMRSNSNNPSGSRN